MIKVLAITLLLIHLFNIAGYNLLFRYSISESDTRLIRELDANKYNDNDLVELKVALNLPYYTGSTSPERINGEIVISGTHYNYVKRQVKQDTLYIYCIPNTKKTKLRERQLEYSKQLTDSQSDTKKDDNKFLKKMKWGAEYSNDSFLPFDFAHLTILPQSGKFLVQKISAPAIASPYAPPDKA